MNTEFRIQAFLPVTHGSLLLRVYAVICSLWMAADIDVRAELLPQLNIITFPGHSLEGNSLHDPVIRRLAIFAPAQFKPGERLPVVYYLPGYGGSSAGPILHSNQWLALTGKIADQITPMIIVVPDCRTRWGGSQYLNSPAQGNYADYVCHDIVPLVERTYPVATNGICRIVAGHSSGGFGALRLGMQDQKLFDGVIALSPDSDFPVSHLPLVQLPGVTNASLARVRLIAAGKLPVPKDGDLTYAIGLSAAYAPRGLFHHGQFEWLYDARERFQPHVWQRWLDNDPLTMVRKNPQAFSRAQAVYLDGAAHDEYSANIGAQAIFETLRNRPGRCTFYEPPGHHGDHVMDRLERGLAWIFDRPTRDIK